MISERHNPRRAGNAPLGAPSSSLTERIPHDILSLIASFVNDVRTLDDMMCTCKALRDTSDARHWLKCLLHHLHWSANLQLHDATKRPQFDSFLSFHKVMSIADWQRSLLLYQNSRMTLRAVHRNANRTPTMQIFAWLLVAILSDDPVFVALVLRQCPRALFYKQFSVKLVLVTEEEHRLRWCLMFDGTNEAVARLRLNVQRATHWWMRNVSDPGPTPINSLFGYQITILNQCALPSLGLSLTFYDFLNLRRTHSPAMRRWINSWCEHVNLAVDN